MQCRQTTSTDTDVPGVATPDVVDVLRDMAADAGWLAGADDSITIVVSIIQQMRIDTYESTYQTREEPSPTSSSHPTVAAGQMQIHRGQQWLCTMH